VETARAAVRQAFHAAFRDLGGPERMMRVYLLISVRVNE